MNTAKTALLMTLLTVILVLIGSLVGGRSGALVALILAAVLNFVAYWTSDKIALAMYRAKPLGPGEAPELESMVRELAQRASLPMPRLYLIPNDTPNAFATGRNPDHAAVAVTAGAMRLLGREELMGVLAHELSHVKNRDILVASIAATIAGAITMLASWARWAAIFGGVGGRDRRGGGGLEILAMAIVAPLAAMMIQLAISRSREYMADAGAAHLMRNPVPLAQALRKLDAYARKAPLEANPATAHMFTVSPLRGGGIAGLFSTHPSTDSRVERLMAMVGRGV